MITVKNIKKTYGSGSSKIEALKCVSCDIAPGEKCVIIGSSGSGKTTCLHCLNFLETPDQGEILVGGKREGWHDYNEEYSLFSRRYLRTDDAPCGDDPMLMLFTSGTTGYPKMAMHSYKYALGHYVTARYWHLCEQDGLHFTISETGWGKALWGKLYGQWLCEGAVFVYDFDRFDAAKILPMFAKYNITTFCAPPTMYRMLIKEDISRFDLSSVKHASTAGEALNPEVFRQFEKHTGLQIMEGFGQTETTLAIANLVGAKLRIGSMGKPAPIYDVALMDKDGSIVTSSEPGEIVINVKDLLKLLILITKGHIILAVDISDC